MRLEARIRRLQAFARGIPTIAAGLFFSILGVGTLTHDDVAFGLFALLLGLCVLAAGTAELRYVGRLAITADEDHFSLLPRCRLLGSPSDRVQVLWSQVESWRVFPWPDLFESRVLLLTLTSAAPDELWRTPGMLPRWLLLGRFWRGKVVVFLSGLDRPPVEIAKVIAQHLPPITPSAKPHLDRGLGIG
jgi:hypothetical protein